MNNLLTVFGVFLFFFNFSVFRCWSVLVFFFLPVCCIFLCFFPLSLHFSSLFSCLVHSVLFLLYLSVFFFFFQIHFSFSFLIFLMCWYWPLPWLSMFKLRFETNAMWVWIGLRHQILMLYSCNTYTNICGT